MNQLDALFAIDLFQ